MEMRKFIVEIHPDGSVYAAEYEEPGERLDIRDAIRRIDLECCLALSGAYKEGDKYAQAEIGKIEELVDTVLNTYWL